MIRVQRWSFWVDGDDKQLSANSQPTLGSPLLCPLHCRWIKGHPCNMIINQQHDLGRDDQNDASDQVEQLSLGLASGHSWADCDFNEQPECMWTTIFAIVIIAIVIIGIIAIVIIMTIVRWEKPREFTSYGGHGYENYVGGNQGWSSWYYMMTVVIGMMVFVRWRYCFLRYTMVTY